MAWLEDEKKRQNDRNITSFDASSFILSRREQEQLIDEYIVKQFKESPWYYVYFTVLGIPTECEVVMTDFGLCLANSISGSATNFIYDFRPVDDLPQVILGDVSEFNDWVARYYQDRMGRRNIPKRKDFVVGITSWNASTGTDETEMPWCRRAARRVMKLENIILEGSKITVEDPVQVFDDTETWSEFNWKLVPGMHSSYVDNLGLLMPFNMMIDDYWTQQFYLKMEEKMGRPIRPQYRYWVIGYYVDIPNPDMAQFMEYVDIMPDDPYHIMDSVSNFAESTLENRKYMFPRIYVFGRGGEVNYRYGSWSKMLNDARYNPLHPTNLPGPITVREMEHDSYEYWINLIRSLGGLEGWTEVD